MIELRDPKIINRSMSKLVKFNIDQQLIKDEISDKKRIELIGAAHHMLQDTTAPPHTLPVFHGPTVTLSEANIGKTNGKIILDPMDKWPLTYTPKADTKTFNEVIEIYKKIKQHGYNSPTLFLVEQNSENTKRMLLEEIAFEERTEDCLVNTWGGVLQKIRSPLL